MPEVLFFAGKMGELMSEIEKISAVATVAPMASQVMPTPQQLLQRMSAAAAALWTVSSSGRPCEGC